MNICIATSTFPASPDDSAHAFFLLDVVRVLRAGGHSVSILTQARDPHPVSPLSNLEVDWYPWRSVGSRSAELARFAGVTAHEGVRRGDSAVPVRKEVGGREGRGRGGRCAGRAEAAGRPGLPIESGRRRRPHASAGEESKRRRVVGSGEVL